MKLLGRVVAAAALWALALAPARAADTRLALDYDINFGPVRLIEIETTVDLAPARYDATTHMRTVGVTGFLFPWTSEAQSVGWRTAGVLTPERHRAHGVFRGEKRLVEIDYRNGGHVSSRVEPAPENDWRLGVPPALQQGTIDPLTATLAAIEVGCRGTLRVFDGRRRYNLIMTDMGEAAVEASSQQVYHGPARRCRAVVEALGGFWQTDPRQSETPTTLDSWIAAPRPGMPRLPVYLELNGARGTLRIHLTGARKV